MIGRRPRAGRPPDRRAAAAGSSARSRCSAYSTGSRSSNQSAARRCRLAPGGLEQRVVDRVPDQRVGEQEVVAFRAHQQLLDQPLAAVVGIAPADARSAGRENRWPNTEAACSACLSAGSSRSMRAWTRLCTEPGTPDSARSSAWRSSCSRNSGIARRALHAAARELAARLQIGPGQLLGLARPQAARGRSSGAARRRSSRARPGRAGRPRPARS